MPVPQRVNLLGMVFLKNSCGVGIILSNRQDACSTKSEFIVDGFSEKFLWGGRESPPKELSFNAKKLTYSGFKVRSISDKTACSGVISLFNKR